MSAELVLTMDLTFATASEQRLHLRCFIENNSGSDSVIINLSQVKRSDSAGLALMIDALRLGCHLKKVIFFKAVPEQMKAMMHFCNLTSLFEKSLS